MKYDYDRAPTDPRHGGKLTAEMATERIKELEDALRTIQDQTHRVDIDVLSLAEHIYHVAGMALAGSATYEMELMDRD